MKDFMTIYTSDAIFDLCCDLSTLSVDGFHFLKFVDLSATHHLNGVLYAILGEINSAKYCAMITRSGSKDYDNAVLLFKITGTHFDSSSNLHQAINSTWGKGRNNG